MTERKESRRSKNNRQELKSLNQVGDVVSEWLVNRLSDEFGEDMIVQIEDDGEWTGLSFFLQAKSSTELVGKKLKTHPVYSYQLKVPDLQRWENASPPVVIVVWDVKARTGVWVDAPAAVRRLDEQNEGWRDRASANVHFPVENRLDLLSGQTKLRRRLADLALPSIGKGKEVAVKASFRFPQDEDGKTLHQQLRATINDGGRVSIPGEYVEKLVMSEWWERLYGPSDVSEVTIGPAKSNAALELELVAVGPKRSQTAPVVLPFKSGGIRKSTYSNEATGAPFRITLVLPGEGSDDQYELQTTVSYSFPAKTVAMTASMVSLFLAIRDAGMCQLRHTESGVKLGAFSADALKGIPDAEELLAWERLMTKLSFIEATTRRYGRFDLSNGVVDDDIVLVDRLYAICEEGTWETTVSWKFTLAPDARIPDNSDGEVSMVLGPFGDWDLFGVKIPLDKVKTTLTKSSAERFLMAMKKGIDTGNPEVELKDISATHKLLSWGGEDS